MCVRDMITRNMIVTIGEEEKQNQMREKKKSQLILNGVVSF